MPLTESEYLRQIERVARSVVDAASGEEWLGIDETYEQMCRRLGVEPRPDGWALWNTWGENGQAATMIVTDVAPPKACWRTGPVAWGEPMTFSPHATRHLGLTGQP
ncbi:hypothetical protein [Kutzneria chonburiensis]|uniref:Transposase n=1 Tax=Kutzneria chonburiensis TaxID=1483604 RepID=A0ABV6N8P9_9PSEU|nr:hypothetical protein [Kutzneria chonburiensis]